MSSTATKKRVSRWFWFLGVGALLALLHPYLLYAVARPLVHDKLTLQVDYLLIASGDRRFDQAADWMLSGKASQILAIPSRPRILVRYGILESKLAVAQREMAKRGVSNDKWEIVSEEAEDTWNAARKLEAWFQGHPDAKLLILSDRFRSRHQWLIWKNALPPDHQERVFIHALPNKEYDEWNWWKTKAGLLDCLNGYLSLFHYAVCGESKEQEPEWNPDEFEKQLLENSS